jgi:hypothetical protein
MSIKLSWNPHWDWPYSPLLFSLLHVSIHLQPLIILAVNILCLNVYQVADASKEEIDSIDRVKVRRLLREHWTKPRSSKLWILSSHHTRVILNPCHFSLFISHLFSHRWSQMHGRLRKSTVALFAITKQEPQKRLRPRQRQDQPEETVSLGDGTRCF